MSSVVDSVIDPNALISQEVLTSLSKVEDNLRLIKNSGLQPRKENITEISQKLTKISVEVQLMSKKPSKTLLSKSLLNSASSVMEELTLQQLRGVNFENDFPLLERIYILLDLQIQVIRDEVEEFQKEFEEFQKQQDEEEQIEQKEFEELRKRAIMLVDGLGKMNERYDKLLEDQERKEKKEDLRDTQTIIIGKIASQFDKFVMKALFPSLYPREKRFKMQSLGLYTQSHLANIPENLRNSELERTKNAVRKLGLDKISCLDEKLERLRCRQYFFTRKQIDNLESYDVQMVFEILEKTQHNEEVKEFVNVLSMFVKNGKIFSELTEQNFTCISAWLKSDDDEIYS